MVTQPPTSLGHLSNDPHSDAHNDLHAAHKCVVHFCPTVQCKHNYTDADSDCQSVRYSVHPVQSSCVQRLPQCKADTGGNVRRAHACTNTSPCTCYLYLHQCSSSRNKARQTSQFRPPQRAKCTTSQVQRSTHVLQSSNSTTKYSSQPSSASQLLNTGSAGQQPAPVFALRTVCGMQPSMLPVPGCSLSLVGWRPHVFTRPFSSSRAMEACCVQDAMGSSALPLVLPACPAARHQR